MADKVQENSEDSHLTQSCSIQSKRKRKSERELTILKKELAKNLLWTRESIKEMKELYGAQLKMTEQQIYKWWWDQTRKRSKKQGSRLINKAEKENDTDLVDPALLVSF
mmetsp:Transcript_12198/g.18866  ORF Transcript_12198/g.18866 Transcript_12198/m.18866 type:complete len:109 (+) Transcript_12198:1351-1677(+)